MSIASLQSTRSLFRIFASVISAVTLTAAAALPAIAQQAAPANTARITQAVDDSVLTTLKGNTHPLARPEYDKGPANPSLPADRMQLVLKRSEGQEIALCGNSSARFRTQTHRNTTNGSRPSISARCTESPTPTFKPLAPGLRRRDSR